jgi:succinyl-CoA synthetase beta subunit
MNLHEYQARDLLTSFGLCFPKAYLIKDMSDLDLVLKETGWTKSVLKAQIHSGARGKAGAVKLAFSFEESKKIAQEMLGKTFVTHQTGSKGKIANELLICEITEIEKEFYLGLAIDRSEGRLMLLASASGGIEIESQKPIKIPLPLSGHLRSYHKLEIAKLFGLHSKQHQELSNFLEGLCKAFISSDASLIEINPLVLTKQNTLLALDAKIVIDDNALYRQMAIKELNDSRQEPALEVYAKEHDLAYVSMQGEVGCMVNGAGLAMATMDALSLCGARAANFLDVGGSADQARVAAGFDILSRDPQVKVILVNIFGGIMNCQTLADGILQSLKNHPIHVPLVLRMEGNHAKEGLDLLSKSGLNLQVATDLQEAAEKASVFSKGAL